MNQTLPDPVTGAQRFCPACKQLKNAEDFVSSGVRCLECPACREKQNNELNQEWMRAYAKEGAHVREFARTSDMRRDRKPGRWQPPTRRKCVKCGELKLIDNFRSNTGKSLLRECSICRSAR